MTFADQQEFYRVVAIEHPEQQHFNTNAAISAFEQIDEPSFTVVELGGWDGALAYHLLDRFPILRWINYDIVSVEPQVCIDRRYHPVELDDWFWNERRTADVFVATHMIEHITDRELGELFDCLDVDWIYLEAPLLIDGQKWYGYRGSHILELGWKDVVAMLYERGYEPAYSERDIGLWRLT